jgi:HD-GYP domain-containing protein (c-di-GMP phosphodiesterase class II)
MAAKNSNEEEKKGKPQGGSLKLIYALNAIATTLQESIQSEENVYAVFNNQVVALGLRGGISLLDEEEQALHFKSVALSNSLKKVLDHFEKKLKVTADGFSVPVDQVDVYQMVTQNGQSVFVPDTSKVSEQVIPRRIKNLVKPLLTVLNNPPGIYAPLVFDRKIKGMLNVVGPELTESDIPTLQAFANQIAVALENARLVRKLQDANEELDRAYQLTLEGWVKALDLRDNETEGHTVRAADMTVHLARFMGISGENIPHIRRGSLLHDIGKMAIPDSILRKPGPLSPEEWKVMKQHPKTAHNWLSSIDYLKPAVDIPYCHHEHWDGRGYVQGLAGDDIPFWARIFTVIDVWDAMRSDRPYRKAIPVKSTLKYIREESGKLFDPRVVEAFFDLRSQKPNIFAS